MAGFPAKFRVDQPQTASGFVARWLTRVGKARRFSATDWRLLAESVVTLVASAVVLRLIAFPRVVAWAKRPSCRHAASWSLGGVERAAWLVGLASRATHTQCLTRSITLTRVLARRGIASDLRIGVRADKQQFEAHAWVEWNGHVLHDRATALDKYSAFDTPIGDSLNA
jgi:hypothetical protein